MKETFLISDTHFGHAGVCKFLGVNGTKLRPWNNTEEMDEEMVKRWNEVVKPGDKVYHLGDIAINRRSLSILGRLNGDKVLIKGNHDIFELKDYAKHFRDIRAYNVTKEGIIMSHIPIHPDSKGRFKANIHGHLHDKRVLLENLYGTFTDPFYHNVCVEQIDYRPINLTEVLERVKL